MAGRKQHQISADEQMRIMRLRRTELLAAAHGQLPSEEALHRAVANLQHGVMTAALLTEEERLAFYAMVERYEADYTLNSSADWMQTEYICLLYLQGLRAMAAQDWEAFSRIDGSLRSHLREMKASKRGREGDEHTMVQQSPAEWAAELVARYRAEQARLAEEDAIAAQARALPARGNTS